ncbi:MAG: S8 family serine peptidase, partial [bacterium]
MTKIIYNKIWFLCILIFIISFLNSNISRANEKWVNNELLVQFSEKPWNQPEGKDAFYINELSNVNSTLSDVFEKHGVVKVKIQFNVDYVLEALSNKYDKNKLEETRKHLANLRYRYLLYLNNSDQLDKLKTSLENLDVVIKTSYNKYLYPSLAPNDTDYNQQWALPYIDAEDAWDISVNANNISLAITDGGFQEDHVDLAGNVTIAWDSRDGDGEPTSGVADCDDHGTHVAGIVGAVGNNGNGVSGAFWSGNLMLYKMGSDTTPPGSRCSVASNICENAIADAIADGANIINRSYGYDGWMLDDVQNNPQVLFVNAAGNDGTDLDTDTDTQNLSAENNLIFVANITNSGALATTSNFGGNTVHLAAPGTNIRSTVPTDDYDSLSGTSMASPYVAGVAALAWSQCPTLTSAEVKTLILSSVTVDTTNLGGNVITDGFLNASDAVLDAQSLCDADGDGLTDDEEIALGTDPNNPDTDGDGLNDGDEINFYNTDPLNSDTDGDGINDNIELDNSLDPNDPTDANSDNDGDGLTNAQEILTHNTDPNNSDTDNDGLSDGYEVLTYGTDPLNSDTDGDLLNDNIEQNLNTDPNDSDTDNDGLNDGEEVYTYATDPNNADSDSDGLGDGAEVGLGTDPNDNDSDDDGLNDGEEV